MLSIKFNISVESDGSSIVFEDITGSYSSSNTGGYGGPNIPMSGIVETKLNVVFPGGGVYLLYSNYLPSMGKWRIPASLFSDLNKVSSRNYNCEQNCGCQVSQPFITMSPTLFPHLPADYFIQYDCERPNTLSKFMDGCYEFRYEVYALNDVPQMLCDYYIQTTICEGQRLEVKVDDAWFDVTEDADIDNGTITYTDLQTAQNIVSYRIMDGSNQVSIHSITGTNCTLGGTPEDVEDTQLAAAKTTIFPFYANILKKRSQKAFLVTVDDCKVQEAVSGTAIKSFSLASARLDAIIKNPECGCDCIGTNLTAINLLFDTIKTS